jgi:hypothetical protein
VFWVISVYFNIRNILPKSGRFLLGHSVYVPLTKSLFKSAGITVSHFFSVLPSTLKYLYSVAVNDTVCNADMQHCTQYHLYTAVSRENAF